MLTIDNITLVSIASQNTVLPDNNLNEDVEKDETGGQVQVLRGNYLKNRLLIYICKAEDDKVGITKRTRSSFDLKRRTRMLL